MRILVLLTLKRKEDKQLLLKVNISVQQKVTYFKKREGDYDQPQLKCELQLLPTNHFSPVFASRFPRNLLASSNIVERETSIVKKCLDDCCYS